MTYKINLELNVTINGRTWLNFWDAVHGNDVIAEVKDGKLYAEDGKEINMQEFTEEVMKQVKKW